MIDLSLLPDGGIAWLDASGPKGNIVLSTRLRLARNLQGYVFSQRARDTDRTAVLERVSEASAASDRLAAAVTFRLDQEEIDFVNQCFRDILNDVGRVGFIDLNPRPGE